MMNLKDFSKYDAMVKNIERIKTVLTGEPYRYEWTTHVDDIINNGFVVVGERKTLLGPLGLAIECTGEGMSHNQLVMRVIRLDIEMDTIETPQGIFTLTLDDVPLKANILENDNTGIKEPFMIYNFYEELDESNGAKRAYKTIEYADKILKDASVSGNSTYLQRLMSHIKARYFDEREITGDDWGSIL